MIHDLPITIGHGGSEITIRDDFLVVETEKDKNGKDKSLLILGVPWQHQAGWEPITKGEFKVNFNGRIITIPLSVHKKQCGTFTAESRLKKNA